MLNQSTPIRSFPFISGLKLRSALTAAAKLRSGITLAAVALTCFLTLLPVRAQQTDSSTSPVVVQPGAPGEPSRSLPSTTRATLPPRSSKDVEFMQGMIVHHGQAVEMTALIESRTQNKDIRLLGARISQSQSDEMKFMKRWLEARREPASPSSTSPMPEKSNKDMPGHNMPGHDMSSHHADMSSHHSMPGMLTPKQMDTLRKAKGAEFDRLFLKGMIQHHNGALTMVKELFDTAGAGQDAELFNFATDVDGGQRAEIKIMENMLGKNP
jgi:uncharacterized protein (DUF305 family)